MNRKIGTISKKFFRPYEWIFSKASPWPTYIIKEVTGNWYINLTNAVAHHLMELKAYGWTEQNWTPTPTIPVDILCNNWIVKFSKNMANVNEQTVQLWYYISAQWVITADANNRIYKDFIPVQPNTTYTLSLSSSVYFVSISEYSTAQDSGFVVRKAWSTWSNTSLTITTGANTNFVRFWTNIDRTEITMEEVLAINRQLEIWSTATPYKPFVNWWIYIDWTTEKIWIGWVFSTVDWQWTFVSPSGSTTTRIYKAFNKLVAWTYTVEIDWPFEFIMQYKDQPDASYTQYWNIWTWTKSWEYEITDATMYYWVAIRNDSWTWNIYPSTFINSDWKISIKEANGNVVAEMLFKIGDYADEQEILTWNITRKVGFKVFDGTENWITGNGGVWYNFQGDVGAFDTTAMTCSHYYYAGAQVSIADISQNQFSSYSNGNIAFKSAETTSASDFKTWLANQYAVWTPVIVFFALATPKTETVTWQSLNIPNWNCTIWILEASIENLPLYAKYKATA